MGKTVRFGVLKLGDDWAVVTDQGDRAHYSSRTKAIAAARQMAKVQQGFGCAVELLAQSETSELRPAPLAARPGVRRGDSQEDGSSALCSAG